jgi:hypothetical protein
VKEKPLTGLAAPRTEDWKDYLAKLTVVSIYSFFADALETHKTMYNKKLTWDGAALHVRNNGSLQWFLNSSGEIADRVRTLIAAGDADFLSE